MSSLSFKFCIISFIFSSLSANRNMSSALYSSTTNIYTSAVIQILFNNFFSGKYRITCGRGIILVLLICLSFVCYQIFSIFVLTFWHMYTRLFLSIFILSSLLFFFLTFPLILPAALLDQTPSLGQQKVFPYTLFPASFEIILYCSPLFSFVSYTFFHYHNYSRFAWISFTLGTCIFLLSWKLTINIVTLLGSLLFLFSSLATTDHVKQLSWLPSSLLSFLQIIIVIKTFQILNSKLVSPQ